MVQKIQRKLEFSVRKHVTRHRKSETEKIPTKSPTKSEISPCDDGPGTPSRSSHKDVAVGVGFNRTCLSPIKNVQRNYPASPNKQCFSPGGKGHNRSLFGTDENQCSPQKRRRDPSSVLGSPAKMRKCLFPLKSSPLSSPQKTPVKSLEKPAKEFKHKSCREILNKKNHDTNQCYYKTKQVLNTAQPDRVICREKEQAEINTFLNKHVSARTGGSLYISGAPGTGKTAVLTEMMKNLKANQCDCSVVYLNCMGVKDSMDIYAKLYMEITGKQSVKNGASQRELCRKMEKFVCQSKIANVWILDEIDQLDSKQHEVLYTLFEWPTLEKSSLILIGVANALDLTDRILPRLQAQLEFKPALLNFVPYTKDQIVEIIENRLEQVKESGYCMLEPSAIQFCARKVAAVAGDMRRALDICRRAIETVETSIRVKNILKPTESNSPTKKSDILLKKIGIPHIARVISEVYGCRVIASTQDSESIPLQQKIAVCTLLLLLKKGKKPAKEVTLGNLHNVFQKVCKRYNVVAVDQSDFINMCSLLDTRGIICSKKAKEPRLTKVSLRLNEADLEDALKDKVFVADIMEKGLP